MTGVNLLFLLFKFGPRIPGELVLTFRLTIGFVLVAENRRGYES
jgi:hypothetical protein